MRLIVRLKPSPKMQEARFRAARMTRVEASLFSAGLADEKERHVSECAERIRRRIPPDVTIELMKNLGSLVLDLPDPAQADQVREAVISSCEVEHIVEDFRMTLI